MSATAWDVYREHRARVTRLILDAPRTDRSRLCVLGAGNCNDVDLGALVRAFSSIDLVDLDGASMARGVAAQHIRDPDTLTAIGGLDVSGIAGWVDRWRCESPSDDEIGRCLAAMLPAPAVDLDAASYGVVVSATVLTQLIDSVVSVLSADHPRLLELVLSIRDAHLRLMASLLGDGGTGILVSDLVSSDTCPTLADVAPELLPELLRDVLAGQNFFTGTNPLAVASLLLSDGALAANTSQVSLHGPWKWWISHERVYLTYAVTFTKVPAS